MSLLLRSIGETPIARPAAGRGSYRTFFTYIALRAMEMPFILQSISWSPSTMRMGLDLVPVLRVSDEPLSLRSLIMATMSPVSRMLP